jgi:cytochrome c-type biogenesis protein CcmE
LFGSWLDPAEAANALTPGHLQDKVSLIGERLMSSETSKYLKFGGATVLILVSLAYLAYTGVQESKSYYVTIKELRGMKGNDVYSKRLRVAGNVQPGSIRRTGTKVEFVLIEQDQVLPVVYSGTEAPPDTFKDNSQALADGSFGRDGVFHAKGLQAKCASKYAPAKPGEAGAPGTDQPKSVTQVAEPASSGMSN